MNYGFRVFFPVLHLRLAFCYFRLFGTFVSLAFPYFSCVVLLYWVYLLYWVVRCFPTLSQLCATPRLGWYRNAILFFSQCRPSNVGSARRCLRLRPASWPLSFFGVVKYCCLMWSQISSLLRRAGVVLGFRSMLVWRVPYARSYGISGLPCYDLSVVLFPHVGAPMWIWLRVHALFGWVVLAKWSLELNHAARRYFVTAYRFRVLLFLP